MKTMGRARYRYGFVIALLLAPHLAVAVERPAIGDPAPMLVMRDLRGGDRSLKELSGRAGLVVLFWARWSERSIDELRRLDEAAQVLSARGVAIAAVNVDRESLDDDETLRLRNHVDQLAVRVPVLVDHGLRLFHAYGVVTIPSTAVIDGNGRLAYFLFGYSHEQREELFDAINRLAGITRASPVKRPAVEPAALRRLQLGRLQLAQGRADSARSSFETAIKADETFPDPIVELAALALDSGEAAAARELLDRAAALQAGHVGVRRERARLAALETRVAEAETTLDEVTASEADATAAAYLGYLMQAAGDSRRAAAAFERAKTISGLDPRAYGGDLSSVAAALRAMAAYRREVAAPRR
jgi:peroxiredoxin/Tfp pilus assembly protein PilF